MPRRRFAAASFAPVCNACRRAGFPVHSRTPPVVAPPLWLPLPPRGDLVGEVWGGGAVRVGEGISPNRAAPSNTIPLWL